MNNGFFGLLEPSKICNAKIAAFALETYHFAKLKTKPRAKKISAWVLVPKKQFIC